MSKDSETLVEEAPQKQEPAPGDFPSIGIDLFRRVNVKIAVFLFIIGAVIFSDVFLESVLPSKYVNGDCANTTGTMIQLMCLVLSYLVIDLIVQGGLL